MKSVDAFRTRLDVLTESIRTEEPRDLRRLCSGIVDSAAGSKGQYFTTLVFAHGEVRNLAFHGFMHVLRLMDDGSIGVSVLKKVINSLMESRVGFLDFLGLHDMASICREYLSLVRESDDVQELRLATELLSEYGVRIHWWLEAMFPWELGACKVRITEPDAEWLLAQTSAGSWSEVAFPGY
jgi:hypothetical protein